ncbi:DUF2249 domain-containing protein [Paracoccus sp. (in: a-proteobacteria)]|uniref:DUF2249 domain-containing protein n=1 Tax=Paracoccus sp. TaxID=267 RepID=UPI0032204EFB
MTPTDAVQELDVRPALAAGDEPFGLIMDAVAALAPGMSLRLIAPFKPVPLFNVMAREGFSAEARQRRDGDWEVLFTPEHRPETTLAPGTASHANLWPDPQRSLDLTGMMPPEPMVQILTGLEEMAPGAVLFALLDREPLLLFPELAARGHEWAGNFAPDGASYRLMVRRGARE